MGKGVDSQGYAPVICFSTKVKLLLPPTGCSCPDNCHGRICQVHNAQQTLSSVMLHNPVTEYHFPQCHIAWVLHLLSIFHGVKNRFLLFEMTVVTATFLPKTLTIWRILSKQSRKAQCHSSSAPTFQTLLKKWFHFELSQGETKIWRF